MKTVYIVISVMPCVDNVRILSAYTNYKDAKRYFKKYIENNRIFEHETVQIRAYSNISYDVLDEY